MSCYLNTKDIYVTMSMCPETIHSFYGFPQELYDMRYRCPSIIEVAKQIIELALEVIGDSERGLDHGAWKILFHLYPLPDIPVVLLSINNRKPSE
jgi:4,5-DOPA dioxygenase extradiol